MCPQSILSKIRKKYQNFSTESFQFLQPKKSLYIAWARFRNVTYSLTGDRRQFCFLDANCLVVEKAGAVLDIGLEITYETTAPDNDSQTIDYN